MTHNKKIVGFTASSFDLLHAGHITMLQEAKSVCDYLVVALIADPTISKAEKNKPVQSLLERYIQISAVKYVDEVIPINDEDDLFNLLLVIKPDIRIVGEEYRDKLFTGSHLPIPIHFNSRRHDFSSTSLRARVAAEERVSVPTNQNKSQ